MDDARARKTAYEQLRRESTWRLLSATKAPAVLAVLQSVFPAGDRRLEQSELMARVESHLGLLVDQERESGMTARDYVADWVREGYLTRRDDPGRVETTFEPSPATIDAVQFIASLEDHQPTTTQSRLTLVVQQFDRLAQETESDRDRRLADLQQQRRRIEQQIADLSEGELFLPSPEASLDRLRDLLRIAADLSSDFLQYREDLRRVDLDLREQILSPEGSRGEILEQLLAGDDLLGQSAVGRTFTAFFKLLNDPVQNQHAQEVVDRLLARDFAAQLTRIEREKLANIFSALYVPAQEVLDVKSELYRSLARFVRSQDFREHRVLVDLLQEAQHLALAQKDTITSRTPFGLEPDLSRAGIRSISQQQLKDPSDPGSPEVPEQVTTRTLSVEVLSELVRTQDIDLVELTGNVNDVIARSGQATVADVLRARPASQGLASLIGLMFLATTSARPQEGGSEVVEWTEPDGTPYAARIPRFFFLDELPAA